MFILTFVYVVQITAYVSGFSVRHDLTIQRFCLSPKLLSQECSRGALYSGEAVRFGVFRCEKRWGNSASGGAMGTVGREDSGQGRTPYVNSEPKKSRKMFYIRDKQK